MSDSPRHALRNRLSDLPPAQRQTVLQTLIKMAHPSSRRAYQLNAWMEEAAQEQAAIIATEHHLSTMRQLTPRPRSNTARVRPPQPTQLLTSPHRNAAAVALAKAQSQSKPRAQSKPLPPHSEPALARTALHHEIGSGGSAVTDEEIEEAHRLIKAHLPSRFATFHKAFQTLDEDHSGELTIFEVPVTSHRAPRPTYTSRCLFLPSPLPASRCLSLAPRAFAR